MNFLELLCCDRPTLTAIQSRFDFFIPTPLTTQCQRSGWPSYLQTNDVDENTQNHDTGFSPRLTQFHSVRKKRRKQRPIYNIAQTFCLKIFSLNIFIFFIWYSSSIIRIRKCSSEGRQLILMSKRLCFRAFRVWVTETCMLYIPHNFHLGRHQILKWTP